MALYCSPCGNQRGWPTHYTSVARGNCEICGTDDILHDVNDIPTHTTDRDELVERLEDMATELSGSSIRNGCADCGMASNTASEALARITQLEAEVERLNEALAATDCVGIEKGKIVSVHFLDDKGGFPLFQFLSEKIADRAALHQGDRKP